MIYCKRKMCKIVERRTAHDKKQICKMKYKIEKGNGECVKATTTRP